MRHGLLDVASLQHMLCDTLDRSDDIVVILEQTGDGDTDIVIATSTTRSAGPAATLSRS